MRKLLLVFLASIATLGMAEKTNIFLERSDQLDFDEEKLPDCQVLSGNVLFRHDNALLYCDSAYFFDEANLINATGHIKINQGDTLFVYGDKLFYDGNTRIARMRYNVQMHNKGTILYTDSLNFDRTQNMGYYFAGGRIEDSTNVLRSVNGTYFPDQDHAIFQKKVILTNPDFVLRSDTLHYNTQTKIANILGPSTITFDSTRIYSKLGWYNTQTNQAELLEQSRVRQLDGQSLTGDTIFYDHPLQLTKGYKNVCLRDSAQEILITGNEGWYNDSTKWGLMVQQATLINYTAGSTDSLFLTADTLLYHSIKDSAIVYGYYQVQSWHPDYQLRCDSMVYLSQDSTIHLFGTPLVWSQENQLSSETMLLQTANGSLERVYLFNSAFVFAQDDSTVYNQISGKEIIGYLRNDALYKVDVDGNAKTVYFIRESDEEPAPHEEIAYTGINNAESSHMVMYFGEDNEVKKIVMSPLSNGTLYTPQNLKNASATRLPGFHDFKDLRPKDQKNIYVPKNKKSLKTAETATKSRKRRRQLH